MGIFRYKVEYYDCEGNKLEDQGLIAASSYGEAAETLEKTIYGNDYLESILFLKALSCSGDNFVMISNNEVIDALENSIIYY